MLRQVKLRKEGLDSAYCNALPVLLQIGVALSSSRSAYQGREMSIGHAAFVSSLNISGLHSDLNSFRELELILLAAVYQQGVV